MKEWYLINENTRPNMTSGFENDVYCDFKEDAFLESLDTDLASDIELYNSSMTESKKLRAIVQCNLANTYLTSTRREILVPIGTIKAGMYVKFENRFWLVLGYPGNNKMYEKAVVELCQKKIKWQKSDGTIIERWANFTSASKYDVGIFRNNHITIASNNFTLMIPDDIDGATLDDKRIFIDHNENNPKKVFQITRSDDVLYLYGEEHGGVLSFIADRTELNMLTDRPDLGICDYVESPKVSTTLPSAEKEQPVVSISGSNEMRVGFKTTYSAKGVTDNNFKWNIISNFKVENTSFNNDITLKVSDYRRINQTFTLQLIVNEEVISSKDITIKQGF